MGDAMIFRIPRAASPLCDKIRPKIPVVNLRLFIGLIPTHNESPKIWTLYLTTDLAWNHIVPGRQGSASHESWAVNPKSLNLPYYKLTYVIINYGL